MTASPILVVTQVDPHGQAVRMRLGDGVSKPSADGGWESVARPRNAGFIDWTGTQPISMDVPVLLDGFAADESVEGPIAVLEAMARTPVGTRAEPAVVRLSGAPVPHANLSWVIQNIDFGDYYCRMSDGARVRQVMTLTFLEYRAPDVLVRQSPAKRAAKGGSHRTYTVRHGDTLPKIASRQLRSANRWREIAKLNNLRDPNHLKVGARLRLP